jgi:hypothetical protein
MQATRRPASASLRARALPLLLICALALAVGPVGHAISAHKHLPRAVAIAAVSTVDEHPAAHRSAPDILPAAPAVPVVLARTSVKPADPSSTPSSPTADFALVRGPPAQAAG